MIGAILATLLVGFAPSSTTVAADVGVAHTALAARLAAFSQASHSSWLKQAWALADSVKG